MEKLGQNSIYSQFLGNKAILRTYKGADLINEYVPLYTPPVDWNDIRTDCPENSIALYAAHSIDYSSYDNLGFTATMSLDISAVGSPTITSGVASGFSNTSWFKTNSNLTEKENSISQEDLELFCECTVGDLSSRQCLLKYQTYCTPLSSEIAAQGTSGLLIFNGKFTYKIGTKVTDTSTNFHVISDVVPVPGNTYLIKGYYTGDNTYAISVSSDGGSTWTTNTGTKDWLPERLSVSQPCSIGQSNRNGSYQYPFNGSINLNNTYIKVKNNYFILPYNEMGYNVFIDGTQYGTTYASGSQCSITWSSLTLDTGDDITTPSALKAHKIWIEPATEGNNITVFHCTKAGSASGIEHQCILWVHFNLSDFININALLRTGTTDNIQCKAITAKNNNIKVTNILECCRYAENLEYIPQLIGDGSSNYNIASSFYQCYKIKQISLKNMSIVQANTAFYKCYDLEGLITSNVLVQPTNNSLANVYGSCYKLKAPLPTAYTATLTNMSGYMTYTESLDNIVLDVSSATNLGTIGCYGSTGRFMGSFKGLRVSNEAPFDNSTTPQINISYTGMDRNALVQLFNNLPYNVGYTTVGSPTINNGVISGFSGSDYLTLSQYPVEMATANNWEVKFTFTTPAAFTDNSCLINTSNTGGGIIFYLYRRNDTACKLRCTLYDNNGGFWDPWPNTDLTTNTKYYAIIRYNSGLFELLVSIDNTNYTVIDSLEHTNIGTPSTQMTSIGYNTRYSSQPSECSIDFNNTYIKINDVYWFRGQPAMTKTLSCVGCSGNQNKLTIVGSPTISDGEVSGFSSSDYLQTIDTIDWNKNVILNLRIKTPSAGSSNGEAIIRAGNTILGYRGDNRLQFTFAKTGGGNNFYIGNTILNTNTYYYIKLVKNSTSLAFYYSTDGVNYTQDTNTWTGELPTWNQSYMFGYSPYADPYSNIIDLNNTSFIVDDELIFGREQYLLPEDKDIATNKNWTLTLS